MRRYNVASPAFDFGGFSAQSEAEALDLCADLGGYILQLAGKAPLTGFSRPQKLDLNEVSVQSLEANFSQDVVGGGPGNAAGVALSLARAHQSSEGFFICGHEKVMKEIPVELRNRDGAK